MPWPRRTALKDYPGVQLIHPLKQRSVELLIDTVKGVSGIKYILIFGSSLAERCTPMSDVDVLFIGRPLDGRKLVIPTEENYDILYADEIPPEASLWDEILKNGVAVYEEGFDASSLE